MSVPTLVTLQSGFVSFDGDNIIQQDNSTNLIDLASHIKLSRPIEEVSDFSFNADIDDIIRELDIDEIDQFTLRERVLKLAKRIFNTNSLYVWYEAQVNSSFLSNFHKTFLIETFNFIYFGKSRSIGTVQWYKLLNSTLTVKTNKPVNFSPKQLFDSVGKNTVREINGAVREDGSVDTALCFWLSHEKGLEDLLLTLKVIFGKR